MEWEAGNVLVANLRPVAFGEVLGLLKLCCDTATLCFSLVLLPQPKGKAASPILCS